MVIPTWVHTKDYLVGRELEKDISSLLEWLSVLVALLILWGAAIFARNRHDRLLE
jgi:hypothetical protein